MGFLVREGYPSFGIAFYAFLTAAHCDGSIGTTGDAVYQNALSTNQIGTVFRNASLAGHMETIMLAHGQM